MPTIDIKAILDAEIAALKAASIPNLVEATGAVSYYLIQNTELLNELISGEFEPEYVTDRLSEEPDIIKAQLASIEVFGQMLAKDAQDTTIQTIITTILAVLGQYLIKG